MTSSNYNSSDDENKIMYYEEENDDSIQSSTKANFNNIKNFSTDDLIYRILLISLERLEEYLDDLTKETNILKIIYLELSEEEKDNFFKKIYSIQVSMQLIFQETFLRRRFLKFSKIKFKLFKSL